MPIGARGEETYGELIVPGNGSRKKTEGRGQNLQGRGEVDATGNRKPARRQEQVSKANVNWAERWGPLFWVELRYLVKSDLGGK